MNEEVNPMNEDRERLLRYLEGDLPADEAQALGARLAHEPALQARLDRLRALRHLMAEGAPEAFAPYFSERVLRRLTGPPAAAAGYESLRWAFACTAVASLLVAVVLGAYNVVDYQSLEVVSTLQEALFGLPSADLSDALYYGAL